MKSTGEAQLIDVFTALVRLATPKKGATVCVVDIINGLAMSSGRSICSKIQRERTQLAADVFKAPHGLLDANSQAGGNKSEQHADQFLCNRSRISFSQCTLPIQKSDVCASLLISLNHGSTCIISLWLSTYSPNQQHVAPIEGS